MVAVKDATLFTVVTPVIVVVALANVVTLITADDDYSI
jgi:hypothetical protein